MVSEEYSLNVRKNGEFSHQINSFPTLEEALKEKRSVKLEEDEETDILFVLYDDMNHAVDAYSIY